MNTRKETPEKAATQTYDFRLILVLAGILVLVGEFAIFSGAAAASPKMVSGSGRFDLAGGPGHEDATITVHYHYPEHFREDGPVLIVIPGGGRNGDDYRDAWIEASRDHGILVLSPSYPSNQYDFAAYHMGGTLVSSNLEELVRRVPESNHQLEIDESKTEIVAETDRSRWLFNDFDRIFEHAARSVGSSRDDYDLFGHSAGGQILHRMTLVQGPTRARRIVAGNSGFYTLPDRSVALPFGLEGLQVSDQDLHRAFVRHLILLLGESDNHYEAGGTFLRSTSADRQGPGRLQRGLYFFQRARDVAEELDIPFHWQHHTVPEVGHDYRAMSRAAAKLLYGDRPGAMETKRSDGSVH